ncbi:MAG: CRTAC1 family protein [Polyangiaceae bacterium]|nr:CRTAC1 family protein [Polyangiaceae bacterium]
MSLRRSFSSFPLRAASGLLLVALAAPTAGCGGDDEPAPPGGPAPLQPICTAGTRWSSGVQAFRDASAGWGLDVLGAEGVRLAAVDFDGDGWTDLVVRRGGVTPDDFAAGGKRQTWLLRNTGGGRFEDVTVASGIRQNRVEPDPNMGRAGEVFAFADVDNDGDLDVYTGLSHSTDAPSVETSEIMLNQGDGTFALGPEGSEVRRAGKNDAPAGAAFVDYDRDGAVDLWIGENVVSNQPQQDRLYRGDGLGGFADVTADLGLTTRPWSSITDLNEAKAHSVAWSAAACDLNGDGDAELLAASYGRAPNHLWQATGAAGGFQFVNRSIASGYAFDDRMDWTDNESARCWCALHPDAEDCTGVPAPQYIACATDQDAFRWDHDYDREPFRLGGNSGATMCADINNDGAMDLFTTEIVHWDVGSSSDPSELLFNTGEVDVRFERPGNEATGLTREHTSIDWNDGDISGAVFDFDNDGWPDVYVGATDYPGNHGLLFHQDSPGHVESVPTLVGIDQHRSHGSAVADFDRDGDLDVVVGHSAARCDAECYPTQQVRMFENVLGQGGNWIQLSLAGAAGTASANRAAIGARVTVTAGGVTQTQEVGGGHGHYGAQNDLTLHFGLGEACEAEVTVRWPDAGLSEQQITLPAGYRFRLEQGGAPEPALAP